MIFNKEFIWYKDHYVYHITNKKNMENIITNGLKPMLGERSISIGDTIKGIYFTDNLYVIDEWMDKLYDNKDSLEVLRFNLKRLKWYIHNGGEDFYLTNKVLPEKLDYLTIYEKDKHLTLKEAFGITFDGKNYHSNHDIYKLDYRWQRIKEYKYDKKFEKTYVKKINRL